MKSPTEAFSPQAGARNRSDRRARDLGWVMADPDTLRACGRTISAAKACDNAPPAPNPRRDGVSPGGRARAANWRQRVDTHLAWCRRRWPRYGFVSPPRWRRDPGARRRADLLGCGPVISAWFSAFVFTQAL